jgi:hypothetical protein
VKPIKLDTDDVQVLPVEADPCCECDAPVFPVGARVLVDGRDEARVTQAFPEGSSSFMFAHYKLDFVGGDRNVAVAMRRVSVKRTS